MGSTRVAKPRLVCMAMIWPAITKLSSRNWVMRPSAMPMSSCCPSTRKLPTENSSTLGMGGSRGAMMKVMASASPMRTFAGASRLPNTAITISRLLTRASGQSTDASHSMITAVV
ncbi:hypothetical protein D3C80_1312820 [compost metagenome]